MLAQALQKDEMRVGQRFAHALDHGAIVDGVADAIAARRAVLRRGWRTRDRAAMICGKPAFPFVEADQSFDPEFVDGDDVHEARLSVGSWSSDAEIVRYRPCASLVCVVAAYLIGSISFAMIASWIFRSARSAHLRLRQPGRDQRPAQRKEGRGAVHPDRRHGEGAASR